MNKFYLLSSSTLDTTFIFIIVIAVLVLIFITCVLTFVLKNNNRKKMIIDEDYIKELIDNLGGKENIDNIVVEERKLKVQVKDLSVVHLDNLKTQAQTGIFVTGNNIKALFKYDASELNKGLKAYMKE